MKTLTKLATVLTGLALAVPALADGANYGPYPAYYTSECGSCHVPYPPQRLTQAGWETQIANLKQHFGTDASIDAPASREILSYLVVNAAWKDKNAPTEPSARITKTRWFVKEHGTRAPKGLSFSNCTACHTQADKGNYSEQTLKTPAGWRHGD